MEISVDSDRTDESGREGRERRGERVRQGKNEEDWSQRMAWRNLSY